jgi:hypothetical protein
MNSAPLMGLDAEINNKFANENSRTVKVCMLKYKCVLLFTFLLLSCMEFVYIMYKELKEDDKMTSSIVGLINVLTNKTRDG